MNENDTGGIEWGRWAETGVIIAVAVYLALIPWWNGDAGPVELVLLPSDSGLFSFKLPVPLIVIGAFLGGFVVTALLTIIGTLRRTRLLRRGQRRIAELELEIGRLRNLPIDEDLHAPPEASPVVLEDTHDTDAS